MAGRSRKLLTLQHEWLPGSTEKHPLDTLSGVYWERVLTLGISTQMAPHGTELSLNSEGCYEREWRYALITVELIQAFLRTKKSAAKATT